MRPLRPLLAFALALACPAAGVGQAADSIAAAPPIVTRHSVRIGDQTVEYDATVGSILLRDASDEPVGEMYYTAYVRTGPTGNGPRPLTFAYNGGPGSASVWLHMGAVGPRRVATPDTVHAPPPPYDLVDNRYSLLDVTDLVMIDPIGTGLSRTVGHGRGADFWGVDEDAEAVAQFITRFLSRSLRWNAPRYLLGESYGATRSAALAKELQERNVDLNGLILLSSVLDFQTISFDPGNDLPYILYLPAYTATAWYHGVLEETATELDSLLEEAESFALGDYAEALLAGARLAPADRDHVLDALARYTGLSREYLDRADLRVDYRAFMKELMREHNLVLGRLDARFTGAGEDWLGQFADYDPQSSAVGGAYTAAFNQYLRGELGWEGDREYVVTGDVRPWRWQQRGSGDWPGHTNTADDLAEAMRHNPTLRVQFHSGLYDLATPYFATEHTIDHLGLPASLREHVETVEYQAGHMMYMYEPALARLKETIAAFIRRTAGGS